VSFHRGTCRASKSRRQSESHAQGWGLSTSAGRPSRLYKEVPTFDGAFGKTHANVADAEVAGELVDLFLIHEERIRGDLRPF